MISDFVSSILYMLKNPTDLVQTVGLIGILMIVFAETGLFLGFFLPGDSLLISAGLLAAGGKLPIVPLVIFTIISTIAGDFVGYAVGKTLGSKLYEKNDSFFFRKKHLTLAHSYFLEHGGKTIAMSRFIPIIRTFVPCIAGAAKMKFSTFMMFDILGAFLWVITMILGGYYLGKLFGYKLQNYLHFIILGVIIASLLPVFYKWIKHKGSTSSC